MTIEERAKEYVNGFNPSAVSKSEMLEGRLGYLKGATDQKAIDDEAHRKDIKELEKRIKELITENWDLANNQKDDLPFSEGDIILHLRKQLSERDNLLERIREGLGTILKMYSPEMDHTDWIRRIKILSTYFHQSLKASK